MKLLAPTVSGAMLIAGGAAAQGIALFGDARLGLGYNVDNDGGVVVDEDGGSPDDLRAVSRVRFGVNLTGQTDGGITFGASILADEAEGGEGGEDGQTEGEVFVSGAWGTLSFGDVDAADQQWVGDAPGNYSLTGLSDINETRFVSNGGSFGEDNGSHFAENPFARPTLRYDFDLENFGFSLSTNRDLNDIGVGAGYTADFAGGSWSVGAGYYTFESFVIVEDPELVIVEDENGNPVVIEGEPVEAAGARRGAVVGGPAGGVRELRRRLDLHEAQLRLRGRRQGRGRQPDPGRLLQRRRLVGRRLLGQGPECRRPR